MNIANPCVAAHFAVRDVPRQGVFFLSEHRAEVFIGPVFSDLAPLLTGAYSTETIVASLARKHGAAETIYAMELLAKQGCITEHNATESSTLAGFWTSIGGRPVRRRFDVHSYCNSSVSDLMELLVDQGLHDPGGEPMNVFLVEDYLDPVLSSVNERALASSSTWMLARPTGSTLWVGPILTPRQTACWECLADRLRLNRRTHRFVETQLGESIRLPSIASPATEQLFRSLFAIELSRWLSRNSAQASEATILTLDTLTSATKTHTVVRRPQCASCGGPVSDPLPVQHAADSAPVHHQDGGLRSATASETYEALKHHVSPITGVVTHLAGIPLGSDHVHVYISGQNYATGPRSMAQLKRTLRHQSSGKGVTEAQAKVSALCEAIERYASEFQGYEHHIVASYRELGDEAIHPSACMQFSEAQYAARAQTNRGGSHFSWVPRELQPDECLWWSPMRSILDGTRKYLPTAHIYFRSERLTDPVGVAVCTVDSNGHAAGRSVAEAVLQGLLELIERDAVALWWYPRSRLGGVDLSSFHSDYVRHSVEHHESLERRLWVLDATSDFGVPTFVALSGRQSSSERIVMGFGSHVDARIALYRSIGELNQMLPGAEASDDSDTVTRTWLATATVSSEEYLWPAASVAPTTAETYPSSAWNISSALNHCIGQVVAAGMQVYVADLTRPDIDLNVVKVICPGLRHFWRRLAPGRLYDIPLALGRTDCPLREADLNPTPMFL